MLLPWPGRRSPWSPGGHPENRLQITPVNPGVCPFKNQEKNMKKNTSCAASPTVSDSIPGTVQWLQTLFLIRLNQCKHIGNWACVRPNQNRKPSQWYWEYEWRHHNKQQRKALQQQNEEDRTRIFPTHRYIGGVSTTTMGSIYIYMILYIYVRL